MAEPTSGESKQIIDPKKARELADIEVGYRGLEDEHKRIADYHRRKRKSALSDSESDFHLRQLGLIARDIMDLRELRDSKVEEAGREYDEQHSSGGDGFGEGKRLDTEPSEERETSGGSTNQERLAAEDPANDPHEPNASDHDWGDDGWDE